MAEPPLLDPDVIETLRSLNPEDNGEFLREIAALFVQDTLRRLEELDRNLASGDVPGFARAAHSIKGSSGNIGASALSEAARRLEAQARASGLAGVAALLQELKDQYARLAPELDKLMR